MNELKNQGSMGKFKSSCLPWELPRFRNWVAVGRVNQLVRRAISEGLSEVGLELSHYDILATLYRYPQISQTELGQRLLVGRSNVSMLLPQLIERKWIKRVVDPTDRRRRSLMLTASGKRKAERGLRVQSQVILDMLDVLSDEECEQVGDMMRRVGQHMIERYGFER